MIISINTAALYYEMSNAFNTKLIGVIPDTPFNRERLQEIDATRITESHALALLNLGEHQLSISNEMLTASRPQ